MCGIAGIIAPERDAVGTALRRATDAQSHRGPDDAGLEIWPFGAGWLGFGHRRLSILDLSPLGHQPMATGPGGTWITYNGEIYNFAALRDELIASGVSFRSAGDTEVLLLALARWGVAALSRLEGMYAFAYFDPSRQRLLLARDPAGIKPLYVAKSPRGLAFASEVRALLATGMVSRKLDRAGIAGMLAYGAVQHPRTLFAEIRTLPPGTYQEFEPADNDAGWRECAGPIPFWNYPTPDRSWTRPRAVVAIRDAVETAVRDHLIADVPVGLFLSSGLDSTILAGIAAKYSPSMHSFTVSFGEHPEFDEASAAERTAELFGLTHATIPLPADEAEAATGEWLAALDQPSIDGLNVFVIARAVRARGIKVALSGLGADELFGGYPSFRDVPKLRRFARLMNPLPKGLRRGIAGVMSARKTHCVRAKLRDMVSGAPDSVSLYLHRRRSLSESQLAELGYFPGELGLDAGFHDADAYPTSDDVADDSAALISRLESIYYQGNMLLRDGDANGMAFGLELRVPFLAQKLIDLAHAIPGEIRVPANRPGKFLLREAFADVIRPELLQQPKRGFALPINRWMRTSLKPICDEALRVLNDLHVVDPAGVAAIRRGFEASPDSPSWSRLFSLCVLGDFIRRTGATL